MSDIPYSGTPLAKKLGLKAPLNLWIVDAPHEYATWLGELAEGVVLKAKKPKVVEAAHVFVIESAILDTLLSRMRKELKQDGFVWVSWPKKSAKVQTDITEDTIRDLALPLGFVDIKVCAINEIWSGLKLVIRRSERQ